MNSNRYPIVAGSSTMDERPNFVPDMHRADPGIRTVSSRTLFMGEHEIGIEHGGSLYRLKITRQGKLILNK